MRVKIADKWFDVTPDTPIMVVLTEADKTNIANMPPDATYYACFDGEDHRTEECRVAWMDT